MKWKIGDRVKADSRTTGTVVVIVKPDEPPMSAYERAELERHHGKPRAHLMSAAHHDHLHGLPHAKDARPAPALHIAFPLTSRPEPHETCLVLCESRGTKTLRWLHAEALAPATEE